MSVDFDEFLRAQLPALLRFAAVLTADADLAQDLSQDALLKAYARRSRIMTMERPDLYLRRMVVNGHRSWWRRASERVTRPVPDVGALAGGTAPDPAVRLADRDEIGVLLATLSRHRRAALVLRFYEDRTDDEIAAVLGCSAGTVRSHISRALSALRVQMRDVLLEES